MRSAKVLDLAPHWKKDPRSLDENVYRFLRQLALSHPPDEYYRYRPGEMNVQLTGFAEYMDIERRRLNRVLDRLKARGLIEVKDRGRMFNYAEGHYVRVIDVEGEPK